MLMATNKICNWFLTKYKGNKKVPYALFWSIVQNQANFSKQNRNVSLNQEELAASAAAKLKQAGFTVLPRTDEAGNVVDVAGDVAADLTISIVNGMDDTARLLLWVRKVLIDAIEDGYESITFSARYSDDKAPWEA